MRKIEYKYMHVMKETKKAKETEEGMQWVKDKERP